MSGDLARHLIVGLAGPEVTALEAAWLAHYQPAGVILFSRNCFSFSQLSDLCARLKALVPGLEITADHEGGPVSQLARGVGRPPALHTLGALDDLALTARVHAETGRRLRAVGVNRVLAPVADVLTQTHNPVIGARAFGGESQLVERHTVAAVTGLLETGIQVCLKHWPGHGGSLTDSHLTDAAAGTGAVAAPFVAGLTAGADAVMVGHLRAHGAELPATLDQQFLAESVANLRRASGCRPRLVADDVTMGGLRAAMTTLGVKLGDGHAAGMIAPEALSRPWLAQLLDAGCEQLLIRGLPLAALPPPPEKDWPRRAEATIASASPNFHDEIYAEARQRSWAVAASDFGAADRDLLWWDLTDGDRWQVAGGDQGTAHDQLGPPLRDHFAGIHQWEQAGPTAAGFERLLVTSHRPLPTPGSRDERLADHGVCLAMGHPSLADDLKSYLGAGWRVGAVYDVSAADLFALS